MRRFQDSWDRFDRAELHRRAFGDRWNAFIDEDPYSPALRIDPNGDAILSMVKPADAEYRVFIPLSLELGEMLYQFRAALDSCVYQAAIYESGQDPPPDEDKLEFPIRPTDAEFKKAAWHLGPLSKPVRDFVESVQPYGAMKDDPILKAIPESLGFLNDWARMDRHRRLHVVGLQTAGARPIFRLPPGLSIERLEISPDGFLLGDEHEVARFHVRGWERGMKIEANPQVMMDIAIRDAPPPRSDTDLLGDRCRNILLAVETILKGFEKLFP